MTKAVKWIVLGQHQQQKPGSARMLRSGSTRASMTPPRVSSSSVSIHPTGSDMLKSFDEHGRPVNLLTIFGPGKQGKSFLMNYLLGSDDAFAVSSLVDPCTTGCDVGPSAVPVEEFSSRGDTGSRYLSPPPPSASAPVVALVDVEGQGDKGDSYDVKLMTPLLVLSKVVMFNWLGKPNKHTMLYRLAVLELAAKRLARSSRTGAFGHLIVVFRDCSSDPAAIMQLLFGIEDLDSATTDEEEKQMAHLNDIRKQLAASFASIDVVSLPICHPEATERNVSVAEVSDKFKDAVQVLREKLSTRLSAPHTFGGMPVQSATVLCDAAEEMVKAVNDEKNDISFPSMLDTIYSSLANRAHEEAYAAFEAVIASLTSTTTNSSSTSTTSSATTTTSTTTTTTTTTKILNVAATENVIGNAVAAGRLAYKEHTLSYVHGAPSASCGAVMESASKKLELRLTAGSNVFREQQKSARLVLNETVAEEVRKALGTLDEETKRTLKPRLPMKLLASWDACEVAVWVDLNDKPRKLTSEALFSDLPAACNDRTQKHNPAAKLCGNMITVNKDALVQKEEEQRVASEKEALKAKVVAEQVRARRAEAQARDERRKREEEARKREEEARAYEKKRAEDNGTHEEQDARNLAADAKRDREEAIFSMLLSSYGGGRYGSGYGDCGGSSYTYGGGGGGVGRSSGRRANAYDWHTNIKGKFSSRTECAEAYQEAKRNGNL